MKEELIKFETAKLAKEKGFSVSCENSYRELLNNEYQLINSIHGYDFDINAPTQSLLQRWLREECKIHMEIIPYEEDPINKWCCVLYPLLCMKEPSNLGEFKTYEQAIEIGLLEALKLIVVG
tara:strand:+ start:116 stop:481 length:366 start_codon:yes stop_codon:yes gene_type:complete